VYFTTRTNVFPSVYEEVIDTDVEQERSTHISIGEVAICSLLI
jgi:hypothetical protein